MNSLSPGIQKKFIAEVGPWACSRQGFCARFADRVPASGEAFRGYDDITNGFLKVLRPAVESARGFLRFPEQRRNRPFEALFTGGRRNARSWAFDHRRDEAYDARFVCQGLSETGLRLVYSFDSSKVDLPQLFSRLWDVDVLDNHATAIGRAAVNYAKRIPEGSPTLRFAFVLWACDDPWVLIYAPPDRILDLFRLAVSRASVSRPFGRNLKALYGSKDASRGHASPTG